MTRNDNSMLQLLWWLEGLLFEGAYQMALLRQFGARIWHKHTGGSRLFWVSCALFLTAMYYGIWQTFQGENPTTAWTLGCLLAIPIIVTVGGSLLCLFLAAVAGGVSLGLLLNTTLLIKGMENDNSFDVFLSVVGLPLSIVATTLLYFNAGCQEYFDALPEQA